MTSGGPKRCTRHALLAAGGSADLCPDEKTSVMTCVLGKRNTGLLVRHAQHGAVVGDKNREQAGRLCGADIGADEMFAA